MLAKGNLAVFHSNSEFASVRAGAPVMVIGRGKYIVVNAKASRAIADRVPRARLATVCGANHMGPVERAEVCNREIAAFARGRGQ